MIGPKRKENELSLTGRPSSVLTVVEWLQGAGPPTSGTSVGRTMPPRRRGTGLCQLEGTVIQPEPLRLLLGLSRPEN